MRGQAFSTTILMTVLACAVTNCSFGQKTELKLNAYSGLFFYRGKGPSSSATISPGDGLIFESTQSFGRKPAFSYAFELQAQKVNRKHHVYGLGFGWEELKSYTITDSTNGGDLFGGPRIVPWKGKVTMSNSSLAFNPYIGQRLITKKMNVDVLLGVDLTVCAKLQETAYYFSSTESKYIRYYQGDRRKYFGDIRPRIQINSTYKQWGVTAGYSYGLQNQYRRKSDYYTDTKLKAYTNFLRLGISYQLK